MKFLGFLLARFTLGNMEHYFVAALYLAVLFPVSGCCLWSTKNRIFLETTFLTCAMLGSTVNTCSAPVRTLSGRIAHSFYGRANSKPEVFFFVLPQNGEVCSVDASGGLTSGICRMSCTWLAVCMMKGKGVGANHAGDELH